MKKMLCLLSLLCSIALASQALAVGIILTPQTQTIGIGDTATVGLSITLGEKEALEGFDFELIFDSTVLGFDSLAFGSDFDEFSDYFSEYDYPAGGDPDIVTFNGFFAPFDLLAPPLIDGTFDVAKLTFTGLSAGSSQLNMEPSNPDLFFPNGNSVLLAGYDDPFPVSAKAMVQVDAVPEPAVLLLLGTGLAGLAGVRRKFRKA